MAGRNNGRQLRAVHRIEGSEGKVVQPGEVFAIRDGDETDRLLRLGAAVPYVEEPAAEAEG